MPGEEGGRRGAGNAIKKTCHHAARPRDSYITVCPTGHS
jgi:hypothetical protein